MTQILKVISALAVFAGALTFSGASAQSVGAQRAMPAVPTTRVLAIGTLTVAPTDPAFRSAMPDEVTKTVALYLEGDIDQWYVRRDNNGVVFILNATSVAEAKAKLARLPLVEKGWMTFELVPMGPLAPLGMLLPPGK